MRISRDRSQAGDTIVEVLICIAIVGVVLTGAFLVATRSSNAVQDSNEHGQAELKLQSQVELLKHYLQSGHDASVFADTNYHCMTASGTAVTDPNGSYNPASPDPCYDPIAGGGANYHAYFKQQNNLYTFTVTWDSLGGGKASESYVYRVYSS